MDLFAKQQVRTLIGRIQIVCNPCKSDGACLAYKYVSHVHKMISINLRTGARTASRVTPVQWVCPRNCVPTQELSKGTYCLVTGSCNIRVYPFQPRKFHEQAMSANDQNGCRAFGCVDMQVRSHF